MKVRPLLPTHLVRAQHLEHDECSSVFASGVFFAPEARVAQMHDVIRKRRRSGKDTKVLAACMPAIRRCASQHGFTRATTAPSAEESGHAWTPPTLKCADAF